MLTQANFYLSLRRHLRQMTELLSKALNDARKAMLIILEIKRLNPSAAWANDVLIVEEDGAVVLRRPFSKVNAAEDASVDGLIF
jgi:indole-3-glycerol phosphate synthase